jgi:valyl-tRNA synthetase
MSPDGLPKRYDPAEGEARLRGAWERDGIYRFDPASDAPPFAIDTPPPTVSGALHVGHAFSYTHTDLVARYQRMRGRNVFYPMGWDDNGLPTERRVQNLHGVRCDPHLPYDPEFRSDGGRGEVRPVSRRNFLELCAQVTAQDERAFEHLWRRLGLSVDWSLNYATIDERSRRISQRAFLDLVRRGEAYSADAPTMWDVDFQTAVAQAEEEDREVDGLEFRLRFGIEGGGMLPIMTTRPELLGACVAVVVHPEDARYTDLVSRQAITPGYRARVPVMAHALAEPDKGTGAVMVCTFGDVTDVTWWREMELPTRIILDRRGCFARVDWTAPGWDSALPAQADALHRELVGLPARKAKARIAELLRDPAHAVDGSPEPPLEGDPTPVRQTVSFYEKGDRPLEILPTRQWFIRLLDKVDALLELGRKVQWHPPFMGKRYRDWVAGLKQDWCVSRQRYFGVPIPLWYRLDGEGRPDYGSPLLPDDDDLPVDPMAEAPAGFSEAQRDRPGGFAADPDVLDTWATSSLTPRIPTRWSEDGDLSDRLCPMDIRPQAHDIIRTWAFYTVARSWLIDGQVPWRHALISGWVRDPSRRKMSKSKGNTVRPQALLDQYGADAVRYWAAGARLGTDTAYDESVFRVGKRLVTKIFNAGKLIVGRLQEAGLGPQAIGPVDVSAPLDRAHLSLLAEAAGDATRAMDGFETGAALQAIEDWFWNNLCDNYLELTKARAYAGDRSALAAWSLSLSAALRLFAPFVPYVTDEVWSWLSPAGPSVHAASWPEAGELVAWEEDGSVFRTAVEVLGQVRAWKAERQLSLRTPLAQLVIAGPADDLARVEAALADIASAAAAERTELQIGESLSVGCEGEPENRT